MSSKNKLRKLKNSNMWKTCLKDNNLKHRNKRLAFFTKSHRAQLKKETIKLTISCKDEEE